MKKWPQFFKVLVGDFIERLWIPPAVVHRVIGELSSTVLLKTNNLATWSVQLSKTDKGVFLGEGWKEFAEHHKLQEDGFLVFTYNTDKKHFSVTVFAPGGLEIDFSFEDVKPKEAKGKVGKSCTDSNFKPSNKSKFPLIRKNLTLEQEYVHNKAPCSHVNNLPSNEPSQGMASEGNLREHKVMRSKNCGFPLSEISEDDVSGACAGNGKTLSSCAKVPAAYYESSDFMGHKRTLKKQKITQCEKCSSLMIEISDDDDAIDPNNHYRQGKSSSIVSSVQRDFFDFVIKKNRDGRMQELYFPSSFRKKHLQCYSQVKVYYGNNPNAEILSVRRTPSSGQGVCIPGVSLLYKHYKFNVGDECRFEHLSGLKFKISKLSRKSSC